MSQVRGFRTTHIHSMRSVRTTLYSRIMQTRVDDTRLGVVEQSIDDCDKTTDEFRGFDSLFEYNE